MTAYNHLRPFPPYFMFWSSKKKKGGLCNVCSTTSLVTMVLAVVVTLAAIVGLYKAHVLSSGFTFGTSTGSLSIVALAISLMLLGKASEKCPCQCDVPMTTKKK
jgi:hypothetical protein